MKINNLINKKYKNKIKLIQLTNEINKIYENKNKIVIQMKS